MTRKIIEERTEVTGKVTRLERVEGMRCPLSTSGVGLASDRATVHVVAFVVTTGIRPRHERPMFGAHARSFSTLRAARAAFDDREVFDVARAEALARRTEDTADLTEGS